MTTKKDFHHGLAAGFTAGICIGALFMFATGMLFIWSLLEPIG